ncbi:similar to Saccharomyces cerevisiae YPR067W ISA2 Protein required for maturation of mitochondrial and cytosolic Fe/S proteins [Maudiozyma saulgeensis]|uniref:Similar to Saccharomyces cerevisiae YPR067W ISA2 Protein required for maturation of mitochondrial and cytosolic Fe/S proteins n=1 Tax=Maudiozyma saulgeensis TaxID=1789683 RepID=A0A1X7QYR0_9SACH|nr:similar to Saccharomyces cerevisiae YPR067W ISA2 Protein required for maturation of mitochondrial and cytosolic Fe/S proteins [Kazachstania saulgeensis]
MRRLNLNIFTHLQGRSVIRANNLTKLTTTRLMMNSLIRRTYATNLEELGSSEKLVVPSKIINKIDDLNLGISERAASRLAQIYKDSQEVLKIGIESGGCHGFQYTLQLIPESKVDITAGVMKELELSEKENEIKDEFEDGADSKLTIYELNEDTGKVIIDPKSLKILNNTILTYTKELIGSSFKISGGSLKSSCGCGSSFDVEV